MVNAENSSAKFPATNLLPDLVVRAKESEVQVIVPIKKENPQLDSEAELEKSHPEFPNPNAGVDMRPAKRFGQLTDGLTEIKPSFGRK